MSYSTAESENQTNQDLNSSGNNNNLNDERRDEIYRGVGQKPKKKNLESSCNWFLNIFFCFFFPFVCRRKPLSDEDIYEVDQNDSCEKNGKLMEKKWKAECQEYEKKLESLRDTNEKEYKKLLKKKPSLGKLIVFKFDNVQLWFGIILFLFQFVVFVLVYDVIHYFFFLFFCCCCCCC